MNRNLDLATGQTLHDEIVECRLAETSSLPGIAIQGDTTVPEEIQFMPPGKHVIVGTIGDKPARLTVNVSARTAAAMQDALQTFRGKSARGEGDIAYFDFNHDDAEASAHPQEFYWGGDDPVKGGVRCKLKWTDPGKTAVLGRAYRRFSPAFAKPNAAGEITDAPLNMGGLVNTAAFKKIQPIWSKGRAANQTQTSNTMETKTEAEINAAIAAKDAEITKLQTQISTLQSDQTVKAKDAEIVTLKGQITTLEDKVKVQAKAAATAIVEAAVKAGKLAPKATEVHARWVDLITVDAKNAELLEAKPAAAGAPGTVIGKGSDAGDTETGTNGAEHAFIVKAKAVATAEKLSELDAFRHVASKEPALYDDYRKNFAVKPAK